MSPGNAWWRDGWESRHNSRHGRNFGIVASAPRPNLSLDILRSHARWVSRFGPLAHRNCEFFEQPVPYPAFEYGSLDVIRTDKEGYVHAPEGPGLGIRTDWKAMERAGFLIYEEKGRA